MSLQIKAARQLLFTFDYELFLGSRSGTATKCLLEPTDAVCAIMQKYKAKGVFFVDVLSLINYSTHKDLATDLDKIKKQLVQLYNAGHYVFPHLHPHWLDAKYDPALMQFDLSNLSRYALCVLDQQQVSQLFKQGIEFLESIGITYPEWGYRAGGWCIQPFKKFEKAFTENNIRYDFSVLPGYKNESKTQPFDFSMVKEKHPYRFSDAPEIKNAAGAFMEYPISCLTLNQPVLFYDRIVRKYLWKRGDRGWGNGIGAVTAASKANIAGSEMISVELLTLPKLRLYNAYLKNNLFMHWISHPKMFTEHGLKMLDAFLRGASSHFTLEFDFKNMPVQ